ncbi:myb proto-oncogene protein [Cryptosporidium ryanae]|uniref:myb proto-oncogene protein n=1 Tax=Cryptosporidium ryanae TaxID=515981 RepID=UPI00351A9142|nr:myb proto-oncogene protein [Cryptosporidium ryanae]
MPQEPWNAEEDELLYQLVQRLGPSSWSETARLLNSTLNVNRLAKQCRERWISHVDPRIRRGDWSLSEDRFILHQQNLWGNRWADIARHLPGRTTHAVKNRYHQLQRLLNQGKTKLETILNAPLISVVPHFLQQTNSVKEGSGKNVVLGLQQKVKKHNKKKKDALNIREHFDEHGSIDSINNRVIYVGRDDIHQEKNFEIEVIHSETSDKINTENEIRLFENLRNKENLKNEISFNQICPNTENHINSLKINQINYSPNNQNSPCLEFQQSPGVLLSSDVGIYPVTPTILICNDSCKVPNVSEPSTCETNGNEYISKTGYSTPSSINNENISPKQVQNICSLNEESTIYSEINYREPNWYNWNDEPTDWESSTLQRLDTGSIVDPFLHSFTNI